MSLTLKHVRYFMAVAEHRAISRAAGALHISQSALTEAVKALEEDLGVPLFDRHPRGMELTRAGRQFQRDAAHIISTVSAAKRRIQARPEAVSGSFNLGTTSMVAGYFLADLVTRYQSVARRVEMTLREDDRFYIEHLLVNGELDAAVVLTSNLVNRDALESVTVVRSPCRIWLSGNHPLLERDEVTLEEVRDEPLIILTSDELEETTTGFWRRAGVRPNIFLKTDSVEAVRSFVANGAGIAILPDMAFRPWSLEGDPVEARDLAEPLPTVDIGFVWCRGVPFKETARAFLELIRSTGRRGA